MLGRIRKWRWDGRTASADGGNGVGAGGHSMRGGRPSSHGHSLQLFNPLKIELCFQIEIEAILSSPPLFVLTKVVTCAQSKNFTGSWISQDV